MPATVTIADFRVEMCDLHRVDYAALDATAKRQVHAYINKANRLVLNAWKWPESWTTVQKAVVDGKIADLTQSDFINIGVYTADPRPLSSEAVSVPIRAIDQTGIWVESAEATVWVQYSPRPTTFTAADTTATLLWMLQDIISAFARSFWHTQEQEHQQAAVLYAEADNALTDLTRTLR